MPERSSLFRRPEGATLKGHGALNSDVCQEENEFLNLRYKIDLYQTLTVIRHEIKNNQFTLPIMTKNKKNNKPENSMKGDKYSKKNQNG